MNKEAQDFGLKSTFFDSPHGLANSNNYSSAHDLAILCAKVIKNEDFRRVVSTRYYRCRSRPSPPKEEKQHETTEESKTEATPPVKPIPLNKYYWENTNKLLSHNCFNGLKTGITPTAGPCLAASYTKEEETIIVIILNSKSMEHRWNEASKLASWAYTRVRKAKQFAMMKGIDPGKVFKRLRHL
jgi:D-alanyl-D-alanine carboxypeptidase